MLAFFIPIRVIDLVDIFLVAVLMYQIYKLIRGTVAFSIFLGVIGIYLLYWIVNALKMKLLSSILGGVIGGGAIALIILFQQEIRRFLMYLSNRYFKNQVVHIEHLFGRGGHTAVKVRIDSIHKACINLAREKVGALIVISRDSSLQLYSETGDILDAKTSSRLLESIFVKNGPLHDGAVIIEDDIIVAARCVLPFTSKTELPPYYGMRHRAGLGISENTDAFVIIISEERGEISIAEEGELISALSDQELWQVLNKKFSL